MERYAEVSWFPLGTRCPWAKEIKYHKIGVCVFDGYFYLEDQTMPVQRVMCVKNKMFLIEITSKRTLQDTSEYGLQDEDLCERICFFPTNVIELKYKILKTLQNTDEFHEVCKELEALEDEILERNKVHKNIREDEEYKKEMEMCKKLNYKEFLEKCEKDTDDDNYKDTDDL